MLSEPPKDQNRNQRERNRQRQRKQNRDRMNPALELRRQNQVDEDDRQAERRDEGAERFAHLLGAARRRGGVFRTQVLRGEGFVQTLNHVLRRTARQQVGGNRHFALAVEALNRGRAGRALERGDLRNRNRVGLARRRELTGLRIGGHAQQRDAVFAATKTLGGAHVNFVLLAATLEVGDFVIADQIVERLRDLLRLHAQLRRQRPVDLDVQFGLARDQTRIHVHDFGQFAHARSSSPA